MKYNLTRSKRKSISLRVTKDATIEVRAPLRMPRSEIECFIKSKERWIEKHLQEALSNTQNRDSFEIDFGSTVMVRGKPCLILPIEGDPSSLRLGNVSELRDSIIDFYLGDRRLDLGGLLFVQERFSPEQILADVKSLLMEYAKQYIIERTSYYAELMNVKPTHVRIGSAGTRWGSCNSRGRINYSWRIIMCNDSVIDYLIVHELAHLIQMNHSPRFWMEVEKFCPNYKKCKADLKAFHSRLSGERW